MTLRLDRMAIEEAGANPARLAAAILRQLVNAEGAVPVHEIAYALDILEIRVEKLSNLEGALIAPPERGCGSILVNDVSWHRQRFTIAHELGHYLSPHHAPTTPIGFHCSEADLRAAIEGGQNRHARQEAEANTFAIDLLAPIVRTRAFCATPPDLHHALELAKKLEISRTAAARRYVEHHTATLAVVFSRDGNVLYTRTAKNFPPLALGRRDRHPEFSAMSAGHLSKIENVDPTDWLKGSTPNTLTLQTLHQQDGWATTLLNIDNSIDCEDESAEDAVDGLERLSWRKR